MSTTGTDPLTQLDAVNMMLEAVFEAPVNTLDASGVEDVAIAMRLLSAKTRQILANGLANNMESNVTLLPDNTGRVLLPNNVLRVDSTREDGRDVVQRGLQLYDRENKTFTFTSAVKCDITYHLEWDDLPEHVKLPIAILAARRYQKHVLGDSDKGGYDKEDELEAKALLGDADSEIDDTNVTTDSWSVYSILER